MSAPSVADRLCRALQDAGAETVFTVPGTQNIGLLHQLARAGLKIVVAASELGAAFMANGYGRSGEKPAVLMTIAGPGITTAITGIAEAHHDSTPLLAIVVEGRHSSRPFSLQALDLQTMLRPVCKAVRPLESSEDAADTFAGALSEIFRGEPGPVVLRIPAPLLSEDAAAAPRSAVEAAPAGGDYGEALTRLQSAKRPLFFIGAGSAGAADVLADIAQCAGIPVLTTCSGRGVLPDDHPFLCWYDFSFGSGPLLSRLIESSDFILAVGVKLTHNGTAGFALPLDSSKLVHVDQANAGRSLPSSLSITADALSFCRALHGELGEYLSAWDKAEIERLRRDLREEVANLAPAPPTLGGAAAEEFFSQLQAAAPSDAIFCTDSGYHQVLARHYLQIKTPKSLLVPADFQSMGFGLPAAIGAAHANPHKRVVALIGDGGLLMSAGELAGACSRGAALTVIVFRDNWYGLIRLQQAAAFGATTSTELPQFSLAELARGLGASFVALDSLETFEASFNRPGVVVAELPVGKMPGLAASQARNAAKEQLRSLFGPRAVSTLKRMLGR